MCVGVTGINNTLNQIKVIKAEMYVLLIQTEFSPCVHFYTSLPQSLLFANFVYVPLY